MEEIFFFLVNGLVVTQMFYKLFHCHKLTQLTAVECIFMHIQ